MLDANKLLKALDAASNSALKLFQVDAIIIKKQKKCKTICCQIDNKYWMQKMFLPVLDAAYFFASKVTQIPVNVVI